MNIPDIFRLATPDSDRVMLHLDRLIGTGEHVYRNRRTVADAYAYVMTRWTRNLPKTWREYPDVSRFYAHMEQDPVVREVMGTAAH